MKVKEQNIASSPHNFLRSAVLSWWFLQCSFAAFSIQCAHVATPWVVGYPACFCRAYFLPLETQLGCLNYSFPGTFKAVASQTDHAGAPQYRKGFSRSSVFMSFSSTLAGKILLWSFVGGRQPYLSSVTTGSNFILKTNTLNDMYWCLHVYGPLT